MYLTCPVSADPCDVHAIIMWRPIQGWTRGLPKLKTDNREILLYVQRRIRVDVGHVFGVKTNPYLKMKYTFEIFHQPAVKL